MNMHWQDFRREAALREVNCFPGYEIQCNTVFVYCKNIQYTYTQKIQKHTMGKFLHTCCKCEERKECHFTYYVSPSCQIGLFKVEQEKAWKLLNNIKNAQN
jgi:hypothetical protein